MPHRDFPIVPTEYDPPSFSVAGEHFVALSEPPGGALADYFWLFTERIEVKAAGLVRFIGACLSEEDEARFQLVIHDKSTVVPWSTLSEIAKWLVEEYTDRPTTPSTGLPAGSEPTAVTPVDGSGSTALTPEGSALQP